MKKLVFSSTLLLVFFFVLSSISSTPVFADCDINDCLWQEHGQQGTCAEGAVLDCTELIEGIQRSKCVGTEWVPTEDPLHTECDVTYSSGVVPWFDKTSQQYDQNLINDAETNAVTMDSYGQATLQGMAQGVRRLLVGSSVPSSGNSTASSGGAVGAVGKMIGMIYKQPPASSVEYIAYMGEKAGFVPKAYAQGVGFRSFFPLIRIWSAMRNTAYLFFAFLLIVVGLLIVFRVKIDPRTVVTVQTALPRIVIAIILVTFSYAIVGLMIDVMNVVIGVLVWLFATAGLIPDPRITIAVIHERNALEIMSGMFMGGAGNAIAKLVEGILPGLIGSAAGLIGGPIVELVLALALISVVFKLLFTLIMAYISIIISVLMAPLQIALNAIPNLNTFQAWLKNLVANLSVFPTVAAMLILAAALTGKGGGLGVGEFSGMDQGGWKAPLIGGGTEDLPQEAIPTLLGYGLLLMTPGMVDQIKKLLQIPPADVPSVGAGIGFGKTVAAAPTRELARYGAGRVAARLDDRSGKTGPLATAANVLRKIAGIRY